MIYERKRYPDGGIYAVVTDFSSSVIVEKVNNYEDLFFLASLKDVCDENGVEPTLVIPCFFQQQHDRRFEDNQSFELRLMARFINSLAFKKVYIFHPHSDVTPALVNFSKTIDNHTFIEDVVDDIQSDNILLMSTDANGFKSLNKTVDIMKWEGDMDSANKSRKDHKLVQMVGTQDFGGKDILIVDDICVYGGTFVGLAKILKERNVGKLYLAVSHMTVKNPSKELEELYEAVYTTTSKYDSYDLKNIKVFSVYQYLSNPLRVK